MLKRFTSANFMIFFLHQLAIETCNCNFIVVFFFSYVPYLQCTPRFFFLFRFFFQESCRRFCLITFQVVYCLSTNTRRVQIVFYLFFFIVIKCARSLTPIGLMHDESRSFSYIAHDYRVIIKWMTNSCYKLGTSVHNAFVHHK